MLEFYILVPTVILLGALMFIFAALLKQDHSIRLHLWFTAWVIIFLRFFIQLLPGVNSTSAEFSKFLDQGTLAVSVILFIASVSAAQNNPFWRNYLITTYGVSAVLFAFAMDYQLTPSWVYVMILFVFIALATIASIKTRGYTAWTYGMHFFGLLLAIFASYYILQGRIDVGFNTFMFGLYFICGILYFVAYKRWSPGVLVASAGFIFWSTSAPVTYWYTELQIPKPLVLGIWNLPKFIVAIGMIVTLLEEGRNAAEAARNREQAHNRQLLSFAEITTRLLKGVHVRAEAPAIVRTVAEMASFRRVMLVLADAQEHLYVAAMSGWGEEDQQRISRTVEQTSPDVLAPIIQSGQRIGQNFCRLPLAKIESLSAQDSGTKYPPDPNWETGDHLMLPLFSQQKNFVGCISMEDPIDVARVNEEDLAPLELLASDLAVAIENVNLQQNLVRSEKLASMGQLVTGVAHELNNPLTAVLGHAELLSERAQDSAMQRDLEVIRREALRMKRIIEDMARFSREQSYQRQEVDLAAILNEVVKLRSMEIHNHGADVRVETASDLPRILAAEIQLKQVVLNVLNNSLDALDGVETKRIVLEASSNGHSIILRVTDTGPGFRDTDRAFDPFYTTKAPGKGTGLGLSLTYGIVRDHGGTIRATNLQPNGACMTIELPVHVSTKQK